MRTLYVVHVDLFVRAVAGHVDADDTDQPLEEKIILHDNNMIVKKR